MTLKKALLRGLVGVPIGVCIGYSVTVLISLIWGGGYYAPVVPAFQEAVGTQSAAVALQWLLCCLVGFVFAAASSIWEVERWSLTRQTVLHLLATSLTMLPVVLICRWAAFIPGGVLGYFGVFIAIYAAIWLATTLSVRRGVRAANQKLEER